MGGDVATGYQRNIMFNREGRTYRNHTHCIETTSDFKAELGFQNRYFRSNTSGCHQSSTINFYPENSPVTRWNMTGFGVYLEDMKGTRIYSELGPRFDVRFETTGLNARWTDYTEMVQPGQFPGVNRIMS